MRVPSHPIPFSNGNGLSININVISGFVIDDISAIITFKRYIEYYYSEFEPTD